MDKILTAKEILGMKGYDIKPKFNIEDFARALGEWFMGNEATVRLILIPYRFADIEDAPKCGFADLLEVMGKFRGTDITTLVPKMNGVQPYPFIIDESFIEEAVKGIEEIYGYKVEKSKKGCYLVSLL